MPTILLDAGNHIWQSTIFAALVGAVALLFSRKQAKIRYGLWMVASVKFLVPFEVFVVAGSYIGHFSPWNAVPGIVPTFVEVIGRPLAYGVANVQAVPKTTGLQAWLSLAVAPVWVVGSLAVLGLWAFRWSKMRSIVRDTTLIGDGRREHEIFARVNSKFGTPRVYPLLESASALEPAIFGFIRQRLILPIGISDRLADSELEAILTHEVCHAKRRDNLLAGAQMVCETLFWFHPAVWWIGGRLLAERERACDEEVLRLGSEPRDYAEGILKVCEFYVGSRLICAAGVSGSNLKRRIEGIMSHREARRLHWSNRLLLITAGVAAIAAPVFIGLTRPATGFAQTKTQAVAGTVPRYESVSIAEGQSVSDPNAPSMLMVRPEEFKAGNISLRGMLLAAYGLQESQLVGGPEWLGKQSYEIEAKAGAEAMEEIRKRNENPPLLPGQMVQEMLKEKFHLQLHRETRKQRVSVLVVAGDGKGLRVAKSGDAYANGYKDPSGKPAGVGLWANVVHGDEMQFTGQGAPIFLLVRLVSAQRGATVVDGTGLAQSYDFTLSWKIEASPEMKDNENAWPHASGAAFLEALRKQLGLQLVDQERDVEVYVIDHAEKPSVK